MKMSILFFSMIFIVGCFKAERSPYDVSTPSGAALSQAMALSKLKPSTPQLQPPVFSPAFGVTTQLTNISISADPLDASIYYTTDGSTPTTSSNLYSSPLVNVWALAGKTFQAFSTKSGYLDSPVVSGVYSYPPLKTGETTSYGSGSDGDLKKGVARGYIDNGDGTVTDKATGLIWQRCSRGQNNDATCTGSATTANWTTAGSYCSGLSLAGKTWRLPTRQELETLFDYGVSAAPLINTAAFPNTVSQGYWTSTVSAFNSNTAWRVNFTTWGFINSEIKTHNNYVRCVSGPSRGYSSHFVDNGDGTITDKTTGLIWQKCSAGQSGTNCTGSAGDYTWSNALNYCNGLGTGWRLPNINELSSIVDTTKATNPTIDTTYFPNTQDNFSYWSSTTYAPDTDNAWYVNFLHGEVHPDGDKIGCNYVRCVSGP